MRQRCACAFAGLILAGAFEARADVVLLRNGDRVSGQIEKLDQAKLALKTEFAGTILIDWKLVAQVSSDKEFDVEAASGRKFRGKLGFAGDGVVVNSADARVPLGLLEVKSVTPPPDHERALAPLRGNVNVGYNFARGNSSFNNATISVNSRYRTNEYQVTMEVSSLLDRQASGESNSRHFGNVRYDRYLSPQSFWFGTGGLEHDRQRKLDLRTNLGGGLGWKLLHETGHEANLLGGITYVNEQYRNDAKVATPGGSSGEALMGVDLRNAIFGGIEATNKVAVTPNLVQLGRYRFSVESGVRMPLLSRYIWSFQLFNRFDSRPPLEAKRNDYGAISSFGVTF